MNKYRARWKKVSAFANKLKTLYNTGKYQLQIDSEICHEASFIIDEEQQLFHIQIVEDNGNHITYCMYEGNLEYDHGAYDKIEITMNRLHECIKLYSIQPIKI